MANFVPDQASARIDVAHQHPCPFAWSTLPRPPVTQFPCIIGFEPGSDKAPFQQPVIFDQSVSLLRSPSNLRWSEFALSCKRPRRSSAAIRGILLGRYTWVKPLARCLPGDLIVAGCVSGR